EERRTSNTFRMQRHRRLQTPPKIQQKNNNIGRCFQETTTSVRHISDTVHNCSYCNAKLFLTETQEMCCKDGIYMFRVQGGIYHSIGSLFPIDGVPRFLQLYIYDTEYETDNRLSIMPKLHRDTLEFIKTLLNQLNLFVTNFRSISSNNNINNLHLLIRADHKLDQPIYNKPTASQVAAVWVEGNNPIEYTKRDIIIQSWSQGLRRVSELSGTYDPSNTRLFFRTVIMDGIPRYYKICLKKKLFQQYIVDNYVKIESARINYLRFSQNKIRSELYQGLQDSFQAGISNASQVGRRIVLPSSFIGGPREMYQRYQDAMALVQAYGRPDIFITIT
ncbi:12785_t:CDS:2, partial [Dentiscutata heterogama]